ncbi:hypothetical protein BGW39_003256 [Mortierella sp. 14UC]|nr:hypothetical protein BGW39_003256 [Mortierella sp. 14UC]
MWNLRTRRGASSTPPSPPNNNNANNNSNTVTNNTNTTTPHTTSLTTTQTSNNKNKRSRTAFEARSSTSPPPQEGNQRVTRAKTFAAAAAAAATNANVTMPHEEAILEDGDDDHDDDHDYEKDDDEKGEVEDDESDGVDGDAEDESDDGDDATYQNQAGDFTHDQDYDAFKEPNQDMDEDEDEDEFDDSENARLYRNFQEQGNSEEQGDDEFSRCNSSDDMESDYDGDEDDEWEVSEGDEGADGDIEEVDDEEEDPELLDSHAMYLKRFRRHDDRDQDPDMGGSTTGACSRSGCTGAGASGTWGSGANGCASLPSSSRSRRYTTGLAGNNWTRHASSRPGGSSATNSVDSDDDRPRYHPEHRVIRQRINDMYRLLGRTENHVQARKERAAALRQRTTTSTPTTAAPPTTTTLVPLPGTILSLSQALEASNQPLTNVSELMDLLIQTHLPQFWRFRAKSRRLNKYRNKPSKNTRPRFWDFLTTCVDCGYKIKKQPIYIETATERKVKASQRAQEKQEKEAREELEESDRLERESRGEEVERPRPEDKGATRKSRGPRKPVLAVSLSTALLERFQSNDESYNYDDMGRPLQHPDQDLRPNLTYHRNRHLTHRDVDDIFNNNRHESTYDGNIDCIGVKEEGHCPSCPTNLSSTAKKATKLHFGWDLVVGFDHSSVPMFPDPRPTSAPTGAYPRSASQAPQIPPPPTGSNYYPARSLLAAFCHLLPRGLDLTQNQIRKLFVYFVWHPWFDCDYQAITIRKGYKELWPLFLLRDEFELTPLEEAFEIQVIKKTKEDKRAEIKMKKKAKEEEEAQRGLGQRSKRLRLDPRASGARSATPSPPPSPLPLEPEPTALQALLDAMKPEERKLYKARIEEARRLQMEIRFTTSFERGLRNHGVLMESRDRTEKERMCNARQIRDGWVLGPRVVKIWENGRQKDEVVDYLSDDGINTDDEEDDFYDDDTDDEDDDDDTPCKPAIPLRAIDSTKEPNNPGKIHVFRANNPRKITKGAHRDKDLSPPPPKVPYPKTETPRFFNNRMTRPKGVEDPLRWIRERHLDRWARGARKWRKAVRFVVPEFFRIKGGEDYEEEVEDGEGGKKTTKAGTKKKPTAKAKRPAKARATRRTTTSSAENMDMDMDMDGDETTSTSASSPIALPTRAQTQLPLPSTTRLTRLQRQHQVQLQQRGLEHQYQLQQQQQRLLQKRHLEVADSTLPVNNTLTSTDINTVVESMGSIGFSTDPDYDSGREQFISFLTQPNSRATLYEQVEQVEPYQQQQQQQQGGGSNGLIQDNNAAFVVVATPVVDAAAQWESLADVERALMPSQQQPTPAFLLASHPGTFLSYQQPTEPAMATMLPACDHGTVLAAIAQAHAQEQAQAAQAQSQAPAFVAAVPNFTQHEVDLDDYISDTMDLYDDDSPAYNVSSSSFLSGNNYAAGAMGSGEHGAEGDGHGDASGLGSLDFF